MSQQALAEAIGWTQPTISRYETGERKPKIEELQKIAKQLGVHWVEFFLPKIVPRNEQEERILVAFRDLDDGERLLAERMLNSIKANKSPDQAA